MDTSTAEASRPQTIERESPMPIFAQVDTPSLMLDETALRANVDRMASFFKGKHAKLRPHFKSHKCTTIARLQMSAGAVGITCAKLGEAEVVADAGIRNILIANQIVGPLKIRRLIDLCRRAEPMVAVDSPENVKMLSGMASAAGSYWRIGGSGCRHGPMWGRAGTGGVGSRQPGCRIARSAL